MLRPAPGLLVKEPKRVLVKNGLVWGDAKPQNILIDTHDDAWLIDFGGSYAEGWVDKDKAGNVRGGLAGAGPDSGIYIQVAPESHNDYYYLSCLLSFTRADIRGSPLRVQNTNDLRLSSLNARTCQGTLTQLRIKY
jgi:serine/threonine protein kinase